MPLALHVYLRESNEYTVFNRYKRVNDAKENFLLKRKRMDEVGREIKCQRIRNIIKYISSNMYTLRGSVWNPRYSKLHPLGYCSRMNLNRFNFELIILRVHNPEDACYWRTKNSNILPTNNTFGIS